MNLRLLPALCIGLIASACTAQQDGRALSDNTPTSNGSETRAALNQKLDDDITSSRRSAITRAVDVASPAVVGINVTEIRSYTDPYDEMFNDPFFEHFFGRRRPRTYRQEVRGLGSGFIVSDDGYIITNDHVAGRASKIVVTTVGGRQYEAKIIGSDPTTDVALLKIDGKGLPYLKLGRSNDVMVGEWVIALGNPFGLFDINSKPTVTVGVVSNTDVDLSPQDNRVYRGMIQTDAAISSGNSGGPLLNALGEVIGMNTVIYSTSQSSSGAGSIGIGFAVPIDRVRAVVDELRKTGSIDRSFWTGMQIQSIDQNIARYLGLSSDSGAVVTEIIQGSPAHRAGLAPGDVIVRIDDEPIRTEEQALMVILEARVGQTLRLGVLRDGKLRGIDLKLESRPSR